jgi:hypothetical protein
MTIHLREAFVSNRTFRVNGGGIVHETIDGEVIIINLETGVYYSLTQSAVDLWSALVEGATQAQLTGLLGARYEAAVADIDAAVAAFLDQLVAETIVIVEGDGTGAAPAAAPTAGQGRGPFEPPVLSKYTNMSDLLLLDPIHDVDEHGWPNKKPD